MVKGSSRKQKGIQRGLKKVFRNRNQDGESASFFSSESETEKKIGKMVEKCYGYVMQTSCKWLFIPMERDEETGFIRPARLWKRLIHYAIVTIYSIIMMYKLIVTIHRAASGKVDLYTYMCACTFIVVFIPATAAVGTTFLPWQICSLLNSWPGILNVLEDKAGKRKSVFDDKVVSFEVACIVFVVYTATINTACYSLVLDIPNCVLSTLKNAGLFAPSPVLPMIAWRLLFQPLEILTLFPPLLVVGVVAMTALLSFEMFNLYADVARSIPIRSIESWEEVYKMYRDLQVYNAVVRNWFKVVSVVFPFGVCVGIILALFITIRPSDIPIIIYPAFPAVGMAAIVLVTMALMKAQAMKLKAEEVAGNLEMAMYNWHVRRFDVLEKKICMRRLKSLRPVSMRIGNFAEPSFDVTFNVWDEVFNQLLFFLSL